LIEGGGVGGIGAAGGEISCVNSGISAVNLLIDRPPVLPLPDVAELPFPLPGAANGIVPVDAIPEAWDPMVVANDGATLIVARGTVAPTLL
jgi:hypothetical protein